MATTLWASSPMALMPFSKLPPEWAALAADLEPQEHAAFASRHDGAAGPARLRIEHASGLARDALDDGPRRWRCDLLIAGDQARERRRRPAEVLEGRQHERVDDEPALHVGDAGPIGAAVVDAERAA